LHDDTFQDSLKAKLEGFAEGTYEPTFDEAEFVKTLLAETPEMKQLKSKIFNEHEDSSAKARLTTKRAKAERLDSMIADKKAKHSFKTLRSQLSDLN
jgi:hypothetical protein